MTSILIFIVLVGFCYIFFSLFVIMHLRCKAIVKDIAKAENAKIIDHRYGRHLLKAKDKHIEVTFPFGGEYPPDSEKVIFYDKKNLYLYYLFGLRGSISKSYKKKLGIPKDNNLITVVPPKIIKKYNGNIPMPDVLYEKEGLGIKGMPMGSEEKKFNRWWYFLA